MNSEQTVRSVIVLGSGPAGYTAAIYAARANLKPLLVYGPLPGGQLTTTTEVENYPGFPEGIMGPDLMTAMESQAKRFGTQVLVDTVVKVDGKASPFTLETQSGKTLVTRALIVATGANPRYLGIENEKELLGVGVSTCATCDGAFFKDEIITVIGGGDSACEEALFLTKFGRKVYLIHRRDELRASKIMAERVLNHEKIEVLWNSKPERIIGDKGKGVTAIGLIDAITGEKRELPCNAVFVAIGHTPNSALFKDYLKLDENGYIIPKANSAATDIPGLFVCGDVQDHVFRQAVTAAGTGCMAAIEAERWLGD